MDLGLIIKCILILILMIANELIEISKLKAVFRIKKCNNYPDKNQNPRNRSVNFRIPSIKTRRSISKEESLSRLLCADIPHDRLQCTA